MFVKYFRNKRSTVVALTSLLLVTFCLIPCGKAGLLNAEAAISSGMKHEADVMQPKHSCHSLSSFDSQLKEGDFNGCLHCDSSTPAIIQSVKSFFSTDQLASIRAEHLLSNNIASNSYQKWATLKPPGKARPIHILHSIFII